ncbi:MAG TPA: DUF3365 domain-containing protein [Flavobacterium sp.]|nr:DUF3365 domain-containing protein [Flavobacterium sp.]
MRYFFAALILTLSGCRQGVTSLETGKLTLEADSVATVAQNTLLKNVAGAIGRGGPEYAVDFCNTRALTLTDSIARGSHWNISRISDRNRNPQNAVRPEDQEVFNQFKGKSTLMDTLVATQDKVVYYKRINIGMPTCLMCHGNPQTDIAPTTLDAIWLRYPQDRATGYKLRDLRGLWKLTLKNPEP